MLTPEFSGGAPAPKRSAAGRQNAMRVGRVHFIDLRRCNEMLDGNTLVREVRVIVCGKAMHDQYRAVDKGLLIELQTWVVG